MGRYKCPRCRNNEYCDDDEVCWDCKKDLSSIWIKEYRKIQRDKMEKKIKVTFSRGQNNIIMKETTLEDNVTVYEEASNEERKEFLMNEKHKVTDKMKKRSEEIIKRLNSGKDDKKESGLEEVAKQIINNSAGVS